MKDNTNYYNIWENGYKRSKLTHKYSNVRTCTLKLLTGASMSQNQSLNLNC